MKSLKNLTLVAIATLFITASSFASDSLDVYSVTHTDEATSYAAQWELYAESAQLTLSNSDLGAAIKWIDKSIASKATVENLEMKADILKSQNRKEMAMAYYLEALLQTKEQNLADGNTRLQAKIWDLR